MVLISTNPQRIMELQGLVLSTAFQEALFNRDAFEDKIHRLCGIDLDNFLCLCKRHIEVLSKPNTPSTPQAKHGEVKFKDPGKMRFKKKTLGSKFLQVFAVISTKNLGV